jgi:hypothetical protein
MYDAEIKQFVLRRSNGDIWNFFHDERQGLCYSNLTKRSTWSNPVTLHKNANPHFHVDMDQEDNFHILFQDNQGNIQYSYLSEDSLRTVPVLNSKTPTAYNKHFYIVPFRNNVHFFYTLQHDNSILLACQILSDGKAGSPKVVDYVTDSRFPCSVICDKSSNIYAFYQSSDGKNLQIGFKKYNLAQMLWSDFIPVTKYDGNCEYPRTVMDASGILHLCYQRHSAKLYEMVYLQKVPDKNLWTNEVVVHSSIHPFDNSSILWINDSIIVYWVRDDMVFYNAGAQSGTSWSKPLKLNFQAGRQLVCLHYKSNTVYEATRIVVHNIPGSFVGGLRLAFHQHLQENRDSLSGEDLRSLILDTLKLLKANIEELKEGESNIKEELSRLISRYDDLERDQIKSAVRLDFLEGKNKQITNE